MANQNTDAAEHFEKQIRWRDLDPTKYLALSAFCTVGIDLVGYPVELVRTRLHVQNHSLAKNPHSFPLYSNTWQALLTVGRMEGVRGLYKGFLVAEIGEMISNMAYFSGYEILKQGMQEHRSASTYTTALSTFLAGGLAESVCCVINMPSDVIAARMQIQGTNGDPSYKTARSSFRAIIKEDGVKGLFRGTVASMMRYAPSSALWWSTYEITKDKLHDLDIRSKLGLPAFKAKPLLAHSSKHPNAHSGHGPKQTEKKKEDDMDAEEEQSMAAGVMESLMEENEVENEDPLIHVTSGMLASLVSTTLLNPIDVARTRIMVQSKSYHMRNTSVYYVLSEMIRKEGMMACTKGLGAALIINVPTAIVSITTYEWIKKISLR